MREKDPRLQSHSGFYDVYRDSENIRVAPENRIKPASTKEQVTVNKVMKGEIVGGYFKAPCLEFYNSKHGMELFDKICFSTFREELPEDPDVSLPDLGIKKILLEYSTSLSIPGDNVIGRARGVTTLELYNGNYQTEDIYVTNWNNNTALSGIIYFTTDASPTHGRRLAGYLPDNINTPIYVVVRQLEYRKSLTAKDLLFHNADYDAQITDYSSFEVLGGGN